MRPVLRFVIRPIEDLIAALDTQVQGPRSPAVPLAVAGVSLVLCWFVYVPVHELLHAAGCAVTGGTVTELQVQERYGGKLLAAMFPFVVPGGDYAGRLTGFDDHGSDWIYLATVFGPFLLTVGAGVPLLLVCMRRRAPVLFGIAAVVGLAPLTNLTGDYHEMGSIIVTRAAQSVGALDPESAARLRSDDIFRLFDELSEQPLSAPPMAVNTVIALSVLAAVLLAVLTHHAGRGVARLLGIAGDAPAPARGSSAAGHTGGSAAGPPAG